MKCPHCKRILPSRLHPRCGHCRGLVPQKIHFSARELREISEEMFEIELCRRKARQEQEREAECRSAETSMLAAGAVVASIIISG